MVKDILSVENVTNKLGTHFIGQSIVVYPQLASTMEIAKIAAMNKVIEGTVIIAEEQTSGRGRLERGWISPKGCVTLSIILYPDIKHLSSLVMVASLAMLHTIRRVTGIKASIKWPNDVLIKGKKVCGILIESAINNKNVSYAVIGIGINVNLNTRDYAEIAPIATSLSDEKREYVSRLDIIRNLLVETEKLYLLSRNSDAVHKEWLDNMDTIGKKVCAKSGENIYEGTVKSVSKDGSLILLLPDGKLVNFSAGDVTLVK
ncbi:MAG: biotin--[acetyl-CoA-carboxylase] ligase [Dehalococcoidales bacterium]|jgi:BirA family biotin operon repressor/biotin-[acetyl-CoA-carboxylase] ligase|nr:biotin--[acetyl-CoA-carboxylase] ligase [Dehalococcoidales bacterium]